MKIVLLFLLLTSAVALFAFQKSGSPKTESRRSINRADRSHGLPFSDGVLVGDTLYLAGRIGVDPKTMKRAATPEEEARIILDGFKAVLAKADMTIDDLVYVQVFCSDPKLFERWNEVYRPYFKKEFPARAFIGSGPLLQGAKFEIQGIAVKR